MDLPLLAIVASTYGVAQLEESGRALAVNFASEPDTLGDLASIRLTVSLWRDSPLEQVHAEEGEISNAEMFRCSVATYRMVRHHVRPPELDWAALLEALIDPDRTLPGGRTVGDLLDGRFEAFTAHVSDGVRVCQGSDVGRFLLAAAADAGRNWVHWYGTPWWPLAVDRLGQEADDAKSPGSLKCVALGIAGPTRAERSEVLEGLRSRPEDLSVPILNWCLVMGLGGFGLSARDLWVARRRG